MRYLIIILVCNCWIQLATAQDLEDVSAQDQVQNSVNVDEEFDSDEDWFVDEETSESSIVPTYNAEDRDPDTYRKEEYLYSLLRQMYYQKLTTPAWSKYLHHDSWTSNVQKWRYLSQLKNFITSNEKDILILRGTPKPTAPIAAIEEDTSRTDIAIDDVVTSSVVKDTITTTEISDIAEEEVEPELEDTQSIAVTITEPIVVTRSITYLDDSADSTACTPEQIAAVEQAIAELAQREEEDKERKRQQEIKKEEERKKRAIALAEKKKAEASVPKPPTPQQPKPKTTTTIYTASNLSFGQRRGQLPWPVKGRVTDRFGIRKNAAARGLRPENYGIDMLCPAGSTVKAIHQGTVLMSQRQSPYDIIVTVKHEDFTTAHFFLITSFVKPGDRVLPGQALGRLRTSVKEADFHFEVWENQERLNPEIWLRKR